MALKLDNNLIDELGLGALPEQEKQLLLRQIYEKLEMNVGVRLADQMSNDQLDEFEKFVDANDDKGAFQWLETNFPNYKDVVNEEFEKLKAEIKQYAPQMLAVAQHNSQQAAGASQQAAAGGQQQAPQGMPGGQYPPQQPQYNPTGHPQPGQYQQPQPQYKPIRPIRPATRVRMDTARANPSSNRIMARSPANLNITQAANRSPVKASNISRHSPDRDNRNILHTRRNNRQPAPTSNPPFLQPQ
jgi:hypothetical protein